MSTNDTDETTPTDDATAENAVEEASPGDGPTDDAPKKKPADDAPRRKSADDATAAEDASAPRRGILVSSGLPWPWVAAVAVVVALCGVVVFGYFKYREAANELTQAHQSEADRSAAAQLAKDYALKSLTYTYQDPDGFFKSVEDGVAPTLKEKYTNVAELLKGIMTQAKVESSGEVLATDVTVQPGNIYQVVVSASQTTKNLQNPQPRVSPIILQVVVNKIGDKWQISDIGPKSGAKPPLPSDPAPPENPVAAAPVPPVNPAAAAPLVPRSR